MSEIRIISTIAVLSECRDGWQKELNIVSVEDGPFVYDIREWRLDHYEHREGISLSEEEARILLVKLGECFQVDVGQAGTVQIKMTAVEQTSDNNEENTKSDVTAILSERNIDYIDRRDRGGALWVIGGREKGALMDELRDMGYFFIFSENGGRATKRAPAWYLTKTE